MKVSFWSLNRDIRKKHLNQLHHQMHHKSDHVHTIAHAESGSLSYITLLRTRTNLRRCLLFEPAGFIHLRYLMNFKL